MEHVLLGLLLLIAYLVRDAELLRAKDQRHLGKRMVLYALSIALAVLAGAVVARSPDIRSYLARIRQPDVVKPLLCLQLGTWFLYTWLRREGHLRYLWMVAAVPSPLLILCLVGVTVFVRGSHVGWASAAVALAAVAIWIGIVHPWTRWTIAACTEDPAWRSGFIAISHALIVVLLPFEDLWAEAKSLVWLILVHD